MYIFSTIASSHNSFEKGSICGQRGGTLTGVSCAFNVHIVCECEYCFLRIMIMNCLSNLIFISALAVISQ